MFVSKRAFVVVVSLALAVGCTAAEVADGSSNAGDPGSAASSEANGANGSPEGNGGEEGASSSSSGAPSGSSSGGSSSGGSSSGGSSSGSPAPTPVTWDCKRCSAFATSEKTSGAMEGWEMCNGDYDYDKGFEPKSAELYTAYLGCLCSGPCMNECETSLCALLPTAATPTCKSCLALNNAACSTPKSACLADQ